jgi:hypothetical protein
MLMDIGVFFVAIVGFVVLVVQGFEHRALCLLSGTLPLEPGAVPFYFRCFLNSVSHLCPGWPGPQSYLCFIPHSWDDQREPPCPAFNG